MDELSQAEFDRITKLPADSLTDAEADFLYARRPYLNKAQRQEYSDLIRSKDEAVKNATDEDRNPPPTDSPVVAQEAEVNQDAKQVVEAREDARAQIKISKHEKDARTDDTAKETPEAGTPKDEKPLQE